VGGLEGDEPLMIALRIAAMPLTMAISTLPIARKMEAIYSLLDTTTLPNGGEGAYARSDGSHVEFVFWTSVVCCVLCVVCDVVWLAVFCFAWEFCGVSERGGAFWLCYKGMLRISS
jgi:hypothetical protein